MDLCGIALASHAEAGKSFAFVLSFFDHSSITFAADSLGLLSDMRVFVCVCIHAYNKYIYVYIYNCIYVHMFIYIYIYLCIHTHT